MSELSELYDRDNGFANYNTTYQWSNPNTPAPYYQSFNISGKGTIDQSIFSIVRMNDSYSLGAYMSFLENGTSTSSHVPTWHSVKNNFSKNNDNITHIAYNDINAYYSYDFTRQFSVMNTSTPIFTLEKAKYSPSAIQYSNQLEQRFLRDFDYNSLVLYPQFGYRYGDYSRQHSGNYYDLKQAQQQYGNVIVFKIKLRFLYSESRDLTNTRTERRSLGIYMQFAGTIPTLSFESKVRGQWYSYINQTGTDSGVYLLVALCNDSNLFYGPMYYPNAVGAKPANSLAYIADYDYTDILPYDYSILDTFDWVSSGNPVRQYCMSFDTATTVLDRLGYNWAATIDSATSSKTGAHCTDPNIRCPVIDPEGNFVTETTLSGTDIADYAFSNPDSNYNWDSGDIEYDGKSIIEVRVTTEAEQSTTEPTEEIDLNEPVLATTGGNSAWILNQQKIDEFFLWLWNPDGTIFDDIVKACALLGENPMDSVVSLKVYPFDLSSLQRENRMICFGRKASPVNASLLTGSNLVNIDLGSFYFNDSGMFNDFRDYEPYSDYSLYIPFVGVIPLQAIECINTTISVKMIVDLVVGACTAVIFTNGVPYKYIDGQIGIDMPVTGRNLAAYGQTILAGALAGIPVSGKVAGAMSSSDVGAKVATGSVNALGRGAMNIASGMGLGSSPAVGLADAGMNFATGAANTAVGGLGLGVIGAIGAAPIIAGAAIPALLNNPQPQTAGCNAPATGLSKPLYPYFIVRRSDCWIPDNYNKLYGRPVQQGGKISDFHGFCKFGNLCLDGIDATEVEKTMINDILQNGVII